MPSYDELVAHYRKRRHDGIVDAVTTGLSLADNVSVDLGLLEDTGVVTDTLETVGNILPFSVIAVTESCRVLMGRKTGAAATGDAAFRMIRTGAAMGIGAAVAAGVGAPAALPAAVASRLLLDHFRSRALTGYRVGLRVQRLRALRESRNSRISVQEITPVE
ncbi:MAG: hypothetical protein J5564_03875 [Clostridia bacterium]|nr:hypothetical protein [Clostridia bacterium]